MKLHRVLLASAFALCAIVSTSHAQVQLLGNTDFEAALSDDGSLIGNWGIFAGDQSGGNSPDDPALSTLFSQSGDQSINLTITGQDVAFAGVQQDVLTGWEIGDELDLTVGVLLDGTSGAGTEFRVEFLDAANDFIGGQFATNVDISGGLVDQEFVTFTNGPLVIPDGTVTVRAVLAVQSFGGGADGDTDAVSVFVDDFTLTNLSAVPEPASASLIVLGLVGLVARRRRN